MPTPPGLATPFGHPSPRRTARVRATCPAPLRRRWALPLVGVCLSVLGTGCAPALNWRAVTLPEADGLLAQFPCKPDTSSRTLTWPSTGQPVAVRLHHCEADGKTWVVQSVRLDSLTQVAPTLRAWPAMLLANLRQAAQVQGQTAAAGPGQVPVPPVVTDLSPAQVIQVPHMTPSPYAQSISLVAGPMTSDPAWRQVRAWHFFHGLTVFQAAVWSSDDHKPVQTSEDVTRPFFEGLKFPD